MQRNYELLSIASGNYSDVEVSALMDTVRQTLVDAQMNDITIHMLGKRRLSYPFARHIRYGVYSLATFSGESRAMHGLMEKLKYVKGIVRASVTESIGKVTITPFKEQVKTVETAQTNVAHAHTHVNQDVSLEAVAHQASKEDVVPTVASTAERKVLTQEELDKRIDALLAQDEVNVEKL